MAQRPYKTIFLDLAACAACTLLAFVWVAIALRLVKDNSTGVIVIVAPLLLGLGAGAFFLGRALNALRRRFVTSMGWDRYLN